MSNAAPVPTQPTPLVAATAVPEESNTTPWWKTRTAKIAAVSTAAAAAVTAGVVAVLHSRDDEDSEDTDRDDEDVWVEVDTATEA